MLSMISPLSRAELEGESNQIRPPVELVSSIEEPIDESPNEIDNLISDIKGKLKGDYQ
jgi:hypothetical protein